MVLVAGVVGVVGVVVYVVKMLEKFSIIFSFSYIIHGFCPFQTKVTIFVIQNLRYYIRVE